MRSSLSEQRKHRDGGLALADRTYRSGFTAGGLQEPEPVSQTILPCDHIDNTHIEPWPMRPRAFRQRACVAARGSALL